MEVRLIDANNLRVPNDAPYKGSVRRVVEQQPTAYDLDGKIKCIKSRIQEVDKNINKAREQYKNASDSESVHFHSLSVIKWECAKEELQNVLKEIMKME